MSNENSSEHTTGDQPDKNRERLIEEIAERYLEKLYDGNDQLDEFIANHPELKPFLEKRLRVVRSLFGLSGESSLTGGTLTPAANNSAPEPEGTDPAAHFFRLNCPNCGVRIQIVDDGRNNEITCGGCGSTIQIDPERTRTAFDEKLPQKIGKFSIIGLLGRGGFGSVYRAEDPDLARTVAIKIPRQDAFESREGNVRFLREARHAAKLHHEGIVRVFDVAEENQLPYIVAEFIDGITLDDLISSRRLGIRQAAELMVQIADAIQFAHDEGVIHRDIKPSNILLDDHGRAHVTDFGLAFDILEDFTITLDGQVLGTPSYMSPEQAMGDASKIDRRTDIYSLGVVLYRMLSGELPFRGSKRMLIYQVIHDDPKPLNRLSDHIPRELDVITRKAMAKDRGLRYASAREFSEDLGRWLRHEPIRAKPDPWVRRFRKWCIRKPAIAALSFSILMLLITCTAITTVWAIQKTRLSTIIQGNLDRITEKEKESSSRLRQLYVNNARHLIDDHDGLSALPWLVAAMQVETDNQQVLRLQFGRVLDDYPTMTGFWDGSAPIRMAHYSADGSQIIALNERNEVKLFRVGQFDENTDEKTFEHGGYVLSAELSPNANHIASLVGDKVIIWDTSTEMTIAVLDQEAPIIEGSFDRTGSRFGSSSINGVAKIWDTTDWKLLHKCETTDQEIKKAIFSPDGDVYVIVSIDSKFAESQIVLWNVASGEKGKTLVHPGQVTAIAFDSSGERFASGGNHGDVIVWNRKTGKKEGILNHASTVGQLTFVNDGKVILTVANNGLVTRWDAMSFQRLDDPFDLPSPVMSADTSADSNLLGFANSDGNLRIFWLNQQVPVCGSLPHGTSATSIDFHPNGRQFIGAGNDGAIKQWDLAGIAPKAGLIMHEGPVVQVRFSKGGQRVATASHDHTGGLWSAKTGIRIGNALKHELDVLDCDFSTEGNRIVTGCVDGTIKVWDGITTAPIGLFRQLQEDPVFRVAFSPNPNIFVSGTQGGSSFVWNVGSNEAKQQFAQSGTVWSIAFSKNGDLLATASDDGSVKIFKISDGTTVATFEHKSPVTYCSFDQGGEFIATASMAGRLTIWSLRDLSNPFQVMQLPDYVTSCNFSFDSNRIVATDQQGGVHIWKKINGKFESEYQFDLGKFCMMYAEFSQDGRFLIAGGGESQTPGQKPRVGNAFLIDVENGIPIGPTLGHFGQVYRTRFDTKSENLVTASMDNTARVWPLRFEPMEMQQLFDYAQLLAGQTINERQQSLPITADLQAKILEKLLPSYKARFSTLQQEIDNWDQYKSWLTTRFKRVVNENNDSDE